jgi:hypothetical protein
MMLLDVDQKRLLGPKFYWFAHGVGALGWTGNAGGFFGSCASCRPNVWKGLDGLCTGSMKAVAFDVYL